MSTQSPRQMAANQQRTLSTIEARLRAMSSAWADVDHYSETRLEELADQVAALRKELTGET